jgi:hypothetical protein
MGVDRSARSVGATTTADGDFVACGVPTNTRLRVIATRSGYQDAVAETRVESDARWRRADVALSPGSTSNPPPSRSSTGHIAEPRVLGPSRPSSIPTFPTSPAQSPRRRPLSPSPPD